MRSMTTWPCPSRNDMRAWTRPSAWRCPGVASQPSKPDSSSRGRPLLDETGLMGLLATPAQREVLDRVQALMSFLEGHGHVVMDRIGGRCLVTQHRMSRVLKARRGDPRHAAFLRITGLEMKMQQYEQGERFILAVERHGGFGALDRAWEGPAHLPTLAEIREPERWLQRVA